MQIIITPEKKDTNPVNARGVKVIIELKVPCITVKYERWITQGSLKQLLNTPLDNLGIYLLASIAFSVNGCLYIPDALNTPFFAPLVDAFNPTEIRNTDTLNQADINRIVSALKYDIPLTAIVSL